MILSDQQIRYRIHMGDLAFDPPLEDRQIQPASVDLRLGPNLLTQYGDPDTPVDSREHGEENWWSTTADAGSFLVFPGEFILASTLERVKIPATTLSVPYKVSVPLDRIRSRDDDTEYRHYSPLVGQVVGRSSLARLGIAVEMAGLIDPGFSGQITLELSNVSYRPVRLYRGDRICQLVLFECGPVDRPYGHEDLKSSYQGQVGTTPSRGLL